MSIALKLGFRRTLNRNEQLLSRGFLAIARLFCSTGNQRRDWRNIIFNEYNDISHEFFSASQTRTRSGAASVDPYHSPASVSIRCCAVCIVLSAESVGVTLLEASAQCRVRAVLGLPLSFFGQSCNCHSYV